jgi:hypothetical protein
MDHAITGTPAETILHGALELSKNSWLLALQLPDRAMASRNGAAGYKLMRSSHATWPSTLNPRRSKRRRQRPDITLLSRQHSAVLDQSRTSPLGGAIAPSLTDFARRAPQRSGSGRKNRLFRSNKRMDESEKGREIGLDSAALI